MRVVQRFKKYLYESTGSYIIISLHNSQEEKQMFRMVGGVYCVIITGHNNRVVNY